MMKTKQFANPFAEWSGHRLFQVVAGTLIGAMVVTSASAMLPTPEPELDDPSSVENAAIAQQNTVNNSATNNAATGSSAKAVTSKITAALVSVDANGQETLVPVDANTRLQSGNIIEYHGYFTNTNQDRVRKMTVTMTIPKQVELLEVLAPEFPFASVDGNTFARMPLQGVVNGQRQEIPLQYYSAVRWNIEGLGLNETTAVKYRAKVK